MIFCGQASFKICATLGFKSPLGLYILLYYTLFFEKMKSPGKTGIVAQNVFAREISRAKRIWARDKSRKTYLRATFVFWARILTKLATHIDQNISLNFYFIKFLSKMSGFFGK